MTPREIDALIAERIFVKDVKRQGTEYVVGFWFVPNYSTDISAAWTIVEKMQAHNPFWKTSGKEAFTSFMLAPCTNGTWACNFGDDKTLSYGDTAAMAICKAALRTMRVEVKNE